MEFNPIEIANNQVPIEALTTEIRQSVTPNPVSSELNKILDSVYTGQENLFGGTGIPKRRQKLSMEDQVSITETHALVGDDWLAKYPTYKVGRDNAEYAAQTQSGLEQAMNGSLKAFNNIGTVLVGNTVGFVNGLGEWAKTGNFNSVFDNSFSRTLDEWNTKLNYQLPNYYTKQAQQSGFWGQLAENPTNTIFNDVFNGLSFTIGTIASEAIWAYATGGASLAVRGGALGAKLANAGKWGKMFLGTDDAVKGLASYKGFMSEPLKNAIRTGQISTGTAKALATTGNVINTARFIATSSGNEAGIEAFHFKKEAEENFYHNFEQLYGREPNAEEISKFTADVEDASNGVFGANMAILGVSNLAMLGGLFGIKSPMRDLQKQINKKVFGVGTEKIAGTWQAVAPTKWQKGSRLLYIPISSLVREGLFEEAGQGVASKTANLWIERKYDPKYIDKAIDLIELAGEASREQYGTKEGWKDIWIGGIVGILGASFTGELSRFKREQQEIETSTVQALNATEKLKSTLVSDITAGRLSAVAVQLEAQDRAERKMLEGDVVQAKLAQYDGLLAGFMLSDKYDDSARLVEDLSMAIDVSQDISTEEKDAFKTSLKDLHNTYKKATSFAESIVGSQGRIYGTNSSTQEAKEALTFVLVQGNNANKLMQESFEEMKAYISDDHASAINQSEKLSELGTDAKRRLRNASRRHKALEQKSEEVQKRVQELQATPKEVEGDRQSRLVEMQNRLIEIETQKLEIRDELDNLAKQLEQTTKLKSSLEDVREGAVNNLGEFISTEDLLKLDERLKALEASYKSMEEFSPANAKMLKDSMERYQNAKKALLDYNSAVAVIARGDFKPRLANDNIFSKLLTKQGNEKADSFTLEFFDAINANRVGKVADFMDATQQSDARDLQVRVDELSAKEELTEEEQAELDEALATLNTLQPTIEEKDDRPSRATATQKKVQELRFRLLNLQKELSALSSYVLPSFTKSEKEALIQERGLKALNNTSVYYNLFDDNSDATTVVNAVSLLSEKSGIEINVDRKNYKAGVDDANALTTYSKELQDNYIYHILTHTFSDRNSFIDIVRFLERNQEGLSEENKGHLSLAIKYANSIINEGLSEVEQYFKSAKSKTNFSEKEDVFGMLEFQSMKLLEEAVSLGEISEISAEKNEENFKKHSDFYFNRLKGSVKKQTDKEKVENRKNRLLDVFVEGKRQTPANTKPLKNETTLQEEINNVKKEIETLTARTPQPQETPTDTVEVLKQRIDNILKMFKAEFVGMDNIEEKIKNKPDQKDIERYRELLAEGQETEEFQELKDKLSKWRVYDSLVENDNESIADLLDQVAVLETQVEEIETVTDATPEFDKTSDLDANKSGKVDNFNLTQNTNFPPTIKVKDNGTIVLTHLKVAGVLSRFQNPTDIEGNIEDPKMGDVITFNDNGLKRTLTIGTGMSIEMAQEDFLAIPNIITSNKLTDKITNWSYSVLYEVNPNGEVTPLKSEFADEMITGHTSSLKQGDTVQLYVDVNHPYNKQLLEEGDKEKINNSVVVFIRKGDENYSTLKSLHGRVNNDAVQQIRKQAVKQLKLGKSGQIGTTTIERVELGVPILTLTENGAITTKAITEIGAQNIEATGFIQNGELTLSKPLDDVRKTYVSKSSQKNKDKKIPVVVIKQGKQLIAFPISLVKTANPQGEKMQAIFDSELLNDAQKVVKINELLIENKIPPRRFDLTSLSQTEKLQKIEETLNAVESFKSAEEMADKNYKKENLINDAEISLDLENLGVYLPSQKLLISFEDVNLKQETVEKVKKQSEPKARAVNTKVVKADKEKVNIRIETEEALVEANKSTKLKKLNLKVGDNPIVVEKEEAKKLKRYSTTEKQSISKITVKPKESFPTIEIDEDNVEEVIKVDDALTEKRAQQIANQVFKSGVEVLEGEMLEDYKKDAGYINKLAKDMKEQPQKTVSVKPKQTKTVLNTLPNLSIDYSEYEVGAVTNLYKKEDGNWYFKDSRGQEQRESAKNRVYLDWLVEEIGQGQTLTNQEFKDRRQDFAQIQELKKTERDVEC